MKSSVIKSTIVDLWVILATSRVALLHHSDSHVYIRAQEFQTEGAVMENVLFPKYVLVLDRAQSVVTMECTWWSDDSKHVGCGEIFYPCLCLLLKCELYRHGTLHQRANRLASHCHRHMKEIDQCASCVSVRQLWSSCGRVLTTNQCWTNDVTCPGWVKLQYYALTVVEWLLTRTDWQILSWSVEDHIQFTKSELSWGSELPNHAKYQLCHYVDSQQSCRNALLNSMEQKVATDTDT